MPKLIVIEGVDASGKNTQTKLLIKHIKNQGRQVETIPFPRHGQQFFGVLVDKYLNNEFGDAAQLDPHIASLFYACDRWEVKNKLDGWLKQGKTIVLDRYATSNMAHQASKIKNTEERNQFINWLHQLEFDIFKIPAPDLVFYLNVPIPIVLDLMSKRDQTQKKYIKNGNRDGLESNTNHLTEARETYLGLCKKYDYWRQIDCVQNNKLLTINQIHSIITQQLD